MILALETSCDDTCAAVLNQRGELLANVISSQEVHDRFGGVVPEIAARHHLELVNAVVDAALARAGAGFDDVKLVAATRGPGLVGALLVGFSAAKGIAAARRLPLAAVDHLQGHVAASFLAPEPFEPPFVSLIASGGHTLLARVEAYDGYELLGQTLDDAAGEAFDKGARLLGLGYPGGPALERLAAAGDPYAYQFPTGSGSGSGSSAFARGLDFSFAGLKTALLYRLRDELGDRGLSPESIPDGLRADLAASYQRAIVEGLMLRVRRALELTGLDRLALGGGVAANGLLRRHAGELGVALSIPPIALCTDNAAMIASAARFVAPLPYPDYLGLDVYASGERG